MSYSFDPSTDSVAQASVVLERLAFVMQRRLSEEFVKDRLGGKHGVSIERDFGMAGWVLRVRSHFYGQKRNLALPPEPATWWDHFKRDAIPTFTRLLRLKVNERHVVLMAGTIYPDCSNLPGDRFYYHEFRDAPEETRC